MPQQTPLRPDGGLLISLPRPIPHLPGQFLEFTYLLGVTLWMGVHGATAMVTAPLLSQPGALSLELGAHLIHLLELLAYLASIASAVLLLTILGMHLLHLRPPRLILLQLGLVFFMTVTAIGPQIWLVPKLASLLRGAQLAPEGLSVQTQDALGLAVSGLGLMGMLHLITGAVLVAFATRRWHTYPHQPDQPATADVGP